MKEEVSNAEEQLTSNTINAVNNSLEGWFLPFLFLIIGIALWLKKPFSFIDFYKKDLQLQQRFFKIFSHKKESVLKVWAAFNFVDFFRTPIQEAYSNIRFSKGMSDF